MMSNIFSKVRGFNYQPSYASTSYESWTFFQPSIWKRELEIGKKHFSNFNTVRLWLSFGAWKRNKDLFVKNFLYSLEICRSLNIKVIPCLFNRWHNGFCDNDGLYLDDFASDMSSCFKQYINDYVRSIMIPISQNEDILIWDLCNEPFAYYKSVDQMGEIAQREMLFLEYVYECAKGTNILQPVGISLSGNDIKNTLKMVEPLCDVLLIHPYIMKSDDVANNELLVKDFYDILDFQKSYSNKANKSILATETCWGSVDCAWRCNNMKINLEALIERNIGFVVHGLYHSKVADLHPVSDGPIYDDMGQFNFIKLDGSLRDGHELFNEYCKDV